MQFFTALSKFCSKSRLPFLSFWIRAAEEMLMVFAFSIAGWALARVFDWIISRDMFPNR